MLHRDKLEIILSNFKTDSFKRDVTLTITATDDADCVIASVRNFFIRFSASLTSFLFQSEFVYTRNHVINVLQRSLTAVNIHERYSDHSFRREAATSA